MALVYFLALDKCRSLESPEAVSVFVEELLRLHRGQGRDILWRERAECPSEEAYLNMVLDKTGGLFRLAVRLMQLFSACRTDFTPLLDQLALYFQIRDDLLNLCSEEYMQSKSVFEDISEGKLSFPVIHALRTRPHDGRLISILKQRTEDISLKRYAVDWLRRCGSLDFTRDRLRGIYQQLLTMLDQLGGEAASRLRILLDRLEAQIDDRTAREASPP